MTPTGACPRTSSLHANKESILTSAMYYDKDILAAGSARSQLHMECLRIIGELAVTCFKDFVVKRPAMVEVVEELKLKRRLDETSI
jgi:hypothetical protein